MSIKAKSKALLTDLRHGRIMPLQFTHGLNRLITVRKHEPTTVTRLDNELYLVQTNDHELIAKLLGAKVEVNAKDRDCNGFINKLRVVITSEELEQLGLTADA